MGLTVFPQLPRKNKKKPKVKGCYQCARRRIDCDRHEPGCQKCRLKGLNCSGLGIRYRFNNGLASRGKLVGKLVPDKLSYKKTPPLIRRLDISRPRGEEREEGEEEDVGPAAMPTSPPLSAARASPECATRAGSERCPLETGTTSIDCVQGTDLQDQLLGWVDTGLDHIDGKTRWHLQYFSDHVAPVTAVIDLGFNGYRDLILPAADIDPLVRKAIVVVADQHLASQIGTSVSIEPAGYSRLIRDLIERSNHTPPDQDESTMTALLLLHIREMVSGSDDFKLVYSPLRTVVNRTGYSLEGLRSRLGQFVKIQILRVCLYGEALFDERHGAQFISARREECLEFLRFCQNLHPEHEELMSYLFDMIKLACDIYIQRAMFDPQPCETVAQVERFRLLTAKVDMYIDTVGRHLLAWSYFVVAAESSTPDHRKFFLDKLRSLYGLTRCGNIWKAIDQLYKIWAVQSTTRWTSLLGGPTQALIM